MICGEQKKDLSERDEYEVLTGRWLHETLLLSLCLHDNSQFMCSYLFL